MWGGLLLAFALLPSPLAPGPPLTLELRAFEGTENVTSQTSITVHRAGDRTRPFARLGPGPRVLSVKLPAGIYDVQALREREGRVVTIRWALRLVVMPYPDEDGRHVEVINFRNGFGALEVRRREHPAPDVTVYRAGERTRPVQPAITSGYLLFVMPAGAYDIESREPAGGVTWETGFDVPLDRTRLWIAP